MSEISSTINYTLHVTTPDTEDLPEGLLKPVFELCGAELAQNHGFKEDGDISIEDRYKAWETYLIDHYHADEYEKRIRIFDDISAFKLVLQTLMDLYPEVEQAYFSLLYRETSDGWHVSDTYKKDVIAHRTGNAVKYYLQSEVRTIEQSEI